MLIDPEIARQYHRSGWWDSSTVSDMVVEHARYRPDHAAYIEPDRVVSWAYYDRLGDEIARMLIAAGIARGERVGLFLPDTTEFHAALLGCERAGVVAVGIGVRAGDAEIAHLLRHTGAVGLISMPEHRGREMTDVVQALADAEIGVHTHLVLRRAGEWTVCAPHSGGDFGGTRIEPELTARRAMDADELWALNSTSGTTGLPKCVTQNQNRWKYFSRLAIDAGELRPDDVFLGAVPSPFGFGLWTAHVCPTVLGVPTVLLGTFEPELMAKMIDKHQVTVLGAVSTQFRMLLNRTEVDGYDLCSLRVLFTGGEAIGTASAAAFEQRTGASVLNFFGSNETGAVSRTTVRDSAWRRFRTAGQVLPEMDVRLYDDAGRDITSTGGPGQPGVSGPLVCGGYYADEAADAELYHDDGHLLMGDLGTLDEDGYLTVVGRKTDIIIRGGKNLSAAEMETAIQGHPSVGLVSVISVPDTDFGERACAVVTTLGDAEITLDVINDYLLSQGVSKELLPEYLLVEDELPTSAGGKIAKERVRAQALTRLHAES